MIKQYERVLYLQCLGIVRVNSQFRFCNSFTGVSFNNLAKISH